MKRFWILLKTELLAWRKDPITAMGGFIPPLLILIAFSLLFGGRLTFKIGWINHDAGEYGEMLRQTILEVQSPFDMPYYDLTVGTDEEIWAAYESFEIDGLWVIPEDFSTRLTAGDQPSFKMYFTNYNDDRAKNHRIYSGEVLWAFYHKLGYEPPLEIREEYPLPQMIDWLPVIGVGAVLLSFMLGGMMNAFSLGYKEETSGITLEYGLAPRSLWWALGPKYLLAVVIGLVTGTIYMLVVYPLIGAWPGSRIWLLWGITTLVILFWVPWVLVFAIRSGFFSGAVTVILTGLTIFFTSGGLNMVRGFESEVPWISWIFPNIYVVDPLRDILLFHQTPPDLGQVIMILVGFAAFSVIFASGIVIRKLRRVG